jgi:hypothetical protein
MSAQNLIGAIVTYAHLINNKNAFSSMLKWL